MKVRLIDAMLVLLLVGVFCLAAYPSIKGIPVNSGYRDSSGQPIDQISLTLMRFLTPDSH